MSKDDIGRCKCMIKKEIGGVKIVPPREEFEERLRRTVVFRCMNRQNNKILNPPLKKVHPTFEFWKEEIEFCWRGKQFGTLEYVFNVEETAYAIASAAIHSEKWIFHHIHTGRMNINLRIGAAPFLVRSRLGDVSGLKNIIY